MDSQIRHLHYLKACVTHLCSVCAVRTHAVSVFQTTSTKSPPPTAVHGCCSPKSILAAAFTNWSPNSTATAAISASATTITDCRTAFTTAAAYCRSTPTKAATNPWPKSSTTTKTKGNTSPISTPTKSAYRAR